MSLAYRAGCSSRGAQVVAVTAEWSRIGRRRALLRDLSVAIIFEVFIVSSSSPSSSSSVISILILFHHLPIIHLIVSRLNLSLFNPTILPFLSQHLIDSHRYLIHPSTVSVSSRHHDSPRTIIVRIAPSRSWPRGPFS
ncbi:hypothetical protein MTO96_034953 [Rhipicephalus appendiculatus]